MLNSKYLFVVFIKEGRIGIKFFKVGVFTVNVKSEYKGFILGRCGLFIFKYI